MNKYQAELAYWAQCYEKEGQTFHNAHYAKHMLDITGEPDDTFLRGKIVADFGCGPRGSLAWTHAPHRRLGLDVLIPDYQKFFGSCLAGHGMEYLPCTEISIPLPDASVDVLFSLNSLDHVVHLELICSELLRILKPGGLLAGSFNLNEPASECEPQNLTEERLRHLLFRHCRMRSYRLAVKHPRNAYKFLEENRLASACEPGKAYVLWATGQKP